MTATTKRESQAKREGRTEYSRRIPGDAGNYEWKVRVDVNAHGYVGINQEQDGDPQRVLLSPAQWVEIVRFVRDEKPR